MPVEVEDFEPDRAQPGDRITVVGSGFRAPGATQVWFWMDAQALNVVVRDDETLEATVPENARTGIVVARNVNGEGRSVKSFEVEDPGPVRVTRFEPTYGRTSQQIKIYGQGFTGGRSVKFGAYTCTKIVWVSDTQIIASVPDNAQRGRVKIRVTTGRGEGISRTDFLID